MLDGVQVEGWKLVPKRASKYWMDTAAVDKYAKRKGMLGKFYTKKLITPAQALKLDPDVNQFIDSKSSGVNVAPDSDQRKAYEDPLAGIAALASRI